MLNLKLALAFFFALVAAVMGRELQQTPSVCVKSACSHFRTDSRQATPRRRYARAARGESTRSVVCHNHHWVVLPTLLGVCLAP